jgi:RimJ/RimL family protein N-acetyltransferase
MRNYKCFSKQEWKLDEYKLVPIRDIDKYEILFWRNKQLDILRQKIEITKEQQEYYFTNVVDKLFEVENPDQLLFSFLYKDELIGYGGLVHIDWESKNSEISFLLKKSILDFNYLFSVFLKLIFKIGFTELNFIKLHTTVFDIKDRKDYIKTLEEFHFTNEGNLKNHIKIKNRFFDVLIYSIFNENHGNWFIS